MGLDDITSTGGDGRGAEGRRPSGGGLARWLAVGLALAGVAYAGVRAADTQARSDGDDLSPAPPEAHRPVGPLELVTRDTLRPGQGLGPLLRSQGLEGSAYVAALEAIRAHTDPRRLRPGVEIRVAARVPERLSRVVLDLDRDRSLHLVQGEEGWRARLDSVPVVTDTIRVGGVIRSSLWNARLFGDTARLAPNEDNEILVRLTQIYAWQVDFFRDIRSDDAFRVLIEREVRPDGTLRRARVLAAEFFNRGRQLPAVRFVAGGGPVEYYDEEGEATRKAFLRAPLRYRRMTSGFSRRRYHPVLGGYRAHRGVDYGAPRGTPVMATGGGVVARAGWWNGYGRVVEIRHNSRHRTRYAHLAGIARGIRPGVRVDQEQVIGYVGSSGLATGPHVHYEFLVNGRQRNPSAVDLPPGEPVPEEHRGEYRRVRDARLSLLRRLPMPGAVRVVRGEDGSGSAGAPAADR